MNELEQALNERDFLHRIFRPGWYRSVAIVADDADATCEFHPAGGPVRDTTSSVSSYKEYPAGPDLFDFYGVHGDMFLYLFRRFCVVSGIG